jgi:hypothetical protein
MRIMFKNAAKFPESVATGLQIQTPTEQEARSVRWVE